jgi:hypothetical protein
MSLFPKFVKEMTPPAKVANPAKPSPDLSNISRFSKGEPIENNSDGPEPGSDHLIQWKTKTGRILYLITSERIRRMAPEGKAVFSQAELEKMRGLPDEQIEAIITTKEVFPGAEVEHHG